MTRRCFLGSWLELGHNFANLPSDVNRVCYKGVSFYSVIDSFHWSSC